MAKKIIVQQKKLHTTNDITEIVDVMPKTLAQAVDGLSDHIGGYLHNGDTTFTSGFGKKGVVVNQTFTAYGIAPIDEYGKIPSKFIPDALDDVVEGYLSNSTNEFFLNYDEEDGYTNPVTPSKSIIYLDLKTNSTYRWGGSKFINITNPIALSSSRGSQNAYPTNDMLDYQAVIDRFKTDTENYLYGYEDDAGENIDGVQQKLEGLLNGTMIVSTAKTAYNLHDTFYIEGDVTGTHVSEPGTGNTRNYGLNLSLKSIHQATNGQDYSGSDSLTGADKSIVFDGYGRVRSVRYINKFLSKNQLAIGSTYADNATEDSVFYEILETIN